MLLLGIERVPKRLLLRRLGDGWHPTRQDHRALILVLDRLRWGAQMLPLTTQAGLMGLCEALALGTAESVDLLPVLAEASGEISQRITVWRLIVFTGAAQRRVEGLKCGAGALPSAREGLDLVVGRLFTILLLRSVLHLEQAQVVLRRDAALLDTCVDNLARGMLHEQLRLFIGLDG